MNFHSNSRHDKGFSIMELMVALGVVGILGLIITQLSTSAIDMFSGIEKSNAINETMSEVRFTLANSQVCNLNLGESKHISFSIADTAGIDIPKISNYDFINKVEAGTVIELNQKIRGLVVSKIKMIPRHKLGDALVLSDLQVTFEKPNSMVQPVTRSLPLLLRVQENEIKECWLKKPTPEVVYNQVCANITNGALNSIDADGKCTLANGKWIKGNSISATCPAGTLLPDDADKGFNCKAVIPAGWSDPFPASPVSMTYKGVTSISSLRQDPYLLSLDKASKTCTCDWASDIPTSTTSTFSCEILCLVP